MNSEQILRKAIEKAVEYGWEEGKGEWERLVGLMAEREAPLTIGSIFEIIFDHKFAEAFVRYLISERPQDARELLRIQYMPYVRIKDKLEHYIEKLKKIILQQMVLEKEPLKYLEKFLEE